MKRYALLFFIIFASAPFAKAEKKVFTCEVCGAGSTTVEEDGCGASQDTTVDTSHSGTLGTLYFGQFSLEVWGVENESPRMELHDSHRRITAV
ncbi:MAG: hypothetical protein ACXVCR_19625, partial [Bdellovibrio sp.]